MTQQEEIAQKIYELIRDNNDSIYSCAQKIQKYVNSIYIKKIQEKATVVGYESGVQYTGSDPNASWMLPK